MTQADSVRWPERAGRVARLAAAGTRSLRTGGVSAVARENIVAATLLLLFVFLLTFGWATLIGRARLVPLPVAAAAAVAVLLQLILQNTRLRIGVGGNDGTGRAKPAADAYASPDGAAAGDSDATAPLRGESEAEGMSAAEKTQRSPLIGMLLVFCCVGLILLIGILPAVFLYICGYLAGVARLSLRIAVSAAALGVFVLYMLFVVLLRVQMYSGVFGWPLL